MTRKKFTKLLMALGYDRNEVEECVKYCAEYTATPIINACNYRISQIVVPMYRNKAYRKYGEMIGLYDSGKLTVKQLGKYARIISRCYMATKDCIMVDKRKKVGNG